MVGASSSFVVHFCCSGWLLGEGVPPRGACIVGGGDGDAEPPPLPAPCCVIGVSLRAKDIVLFDVLTVRPL